MGNVDRAEIMATVGGASLNMSLVTEMISPPNYTTNYAPDSDQFRLDHFERDLNKQEIILSDISREKR